MPSIDDPAFPCGRGPQQRNRLGHRPPDHSDRVRRKFPFEGLRDDAVLAIAAEEGRVLVSHDVTTMPDHFRKYIRHSGSPGVVLVPQELSIGKAIENILLISEACGEHDLANRLCLVPSLVMYGF